MSSRSNSAARPIAAVGGETNATPSARANSAKYLRGIVMPRAKQACRNARGDVPQAQLALDLGTDKARVGRFDVDHEPHIPNVVDVAVAPRAYGMSLIRFQADEQRAQVYPVPDDVHGDNHFARLASVLRETTDVTATLSAGLADDGKLGSEAEIEAVIRESREGIEALRELEAAAVRQLAALRAERGR